LTPWWMLTHIGNHCIIMKKILLLTIGVGCFWLSSAHAQTTSSGDTFLNFLSPQSNLGFNFTQGVEYDFASDLDTPGSGDVAVFNANTSLTYSQNYDIGFYRVGGNYEYSDYDWSATDYFSNVNSFGLNAFGLYNFEDNQPWGIFALSSLNWSAENGASFSEGFEYHVRGHQRVDAPGRRAEWGQLHGVQSGAIVGQPGQGQVGVQIRVAVPREVLAAGRQPRFAQAVMLAAVEPEVLEDRVVIRRVDRSVDDLRNVVRSILAFAPGRPELRRRADRRVARLVRVGGNEQLRRKEQIWRAEIRLLVAQVLADPLRNLLLAALHLDDGERDAVDEQDDVGTDACPLRPIDRKLARHVEGVRPRTVGVETPVDVAEGPFAGLSVHGLGQRNAELDQIGLTLVRAQEPVEPHVFQPLDGGFDVAFREGVRAPASADAIKGDQLSAQRVFKQDAGATVPALPVDLRARDIAPAERRKGHEGLELLAPGFGKRELRAFGHLGPANCFQAGCAAAL